jgi:cellulose synthase/poly-beta-1,6-N-acetylglucosamine synthase-like glycosyltransferase
MINKILMISVLIIYSVALLFIFAYSLTQATLIRRYFKSKRLKKKVKFDASFFPYVTVQLPIYNELYVVERLIDNLCQFDYPADKFEIQVLDDSTDETSSIIRKKVNQWKDQGINIIHVHRTARRGYKAGALEEGLETAKGEFIAIFDSDFLPNIDFLRQTVPYFIDEAIGMVQTKWGHLNRNYSLLTKLQAFGLDAHFSVEQVGRNYHDGFINFNGTAGIWRKLCIIDSGNWQPDTLTEDLDLSYRAQLRDWRFMYLEDVESPAELPPVMSALKTQQYRWTKGGAETARKHLKSVINSNKPFHVKWHGIMHLLNSAIFLSILICSIFSVPLLFIKVSFPEVKNLFLLASLFILSFFILGSMYYVASAKRFKNKFIAFGNLLITFPAFLSISMGLSLHNGIAVIEGYLGRKTPFIRTPKFNIDQKNGKWIGNKYLKTKLNLVNLFELLLAFYFAFGVVKGIQLKDYGLLPFHVMLSIGFLIVFYYSFKQSFLSNKLEEHR